MIHAAVVAPATFLDATSQTPVIVQCLQSAPESWLKWLLPTIVQTIVSLLSIGAGVAIAVWSFRRNRETEHEQWVRDQKKAEWRRLLESAAEIQRVLRKETMTLAKRAREIAEKLKQAAHELSITSASCIFLQDFFSNPEKQAKLSSFLREADAISEEMDGLLDFYNQPEVEMTQDDRSRTAMRIMERTREITERYLAFCEWLRKEAALSLGALNPTNDT